MTSNGKVFNCMLLKKDDLNKVAKKMGINPNGFKKDVCDRILKQIKK